MNIDSKRYYIRVYDDGTHSAEIRDKVAARSVFIPASALPSAHSLATMPESRFNRVCADLISDS